MVVQTVKRLPTMRETQVQSLGQGDLLEKEMAIHSSILAWKVPWMVEPGRLQSMGSQRVRHDWERLTTYWVSLPYTWHIQQSPHQLLRVWWSRRVPIYMLTRIICHLSKKLMIFTALDSSQVLGTGPQSQKNHWTKRDANGTISLYIHRLNM